MIIRPLTPPSFAELPGDFQHAAELPGDAPSVDRLPSKQVPPTPPLTRENTASTQRSKKSGKSEKGTPRWLAEKMGQFKTKLNKPQKPESSAKESLQQAPVDATTKPNYSLNERRPEDEVILPKHYAVELPKYRQLESLDPAAEMFASMFYGDGLRKPTWSDSAPHRINPRQLFDAMPTWYLHDDEMQATWKKSRMPPPLPPKIKDPDAPEPVSLTQPKNVPPLPPPKERP